MIFNHIILQSEGPHNFCDLDIELWCTPHELPHDVSLFVNSGGEATNNNIFHLAISGQLI